MIKMYKMHDAAIIPTRGSDGAAGYDLYYFGPVVSIAAGDRKLMATGVCFEMSPDVVANIRPRSGLSVSGIDVGAGVVDSDYRGEIMVLLINNSRYERHFKAGDRIAQVLFQPVLTCAIEATGSISETERGAGGFGSTGI